MLHALTVEVVLSRPVGDRIVVDAATGRAWEHGRRRGRGQSQGG
ncbi:hypothetical protein ACFCYC_17940 [Streptomyces sp. NPDC056402]